MVAASDRAAQSDLYSAISLAGALGTHCVILAGRRIERSMPAAQQNRLDATNLEVFVVGGTAAVPNSKLSGREVTRIAGTDRWGTAAAVGDAVAEIVVGDDSFWAAGVAQQRGGTARAAPPWDASCADKTAVVAASDAAARSDLYSAVTLAAALGSDCVVLAGDRDGPMPTAQQVRLNASASAFVVLVVGGTDAVPDAKLAGLRVIRVAGADRWQTAAETGDEAVRWIRAFHPHAPPKWHPVERATYVGQFVAVAIGTDHSCGLRTHGRIECWGSNRYGESDPPDSTFSAVSAGTFHSCGLRTDKTIQCWGSNTLGRSDPPDGTFSAVSSGGLHSCGLGTHGRVECWGSNRYGKSDPPDGTFSAVSAGGNHTCGLRTDDTVECWGLNLDGQSDPPDGTFSAVSAGGNHTCGLRTDDRVLHRHETIECWGRKFEGQSDAPSGTFTAVSAGGQHSCGLRRNSIIQCWGYRGNGRGGISPVFGSGAPDGAFTAVFAGGGHACGLRTNGTVECWGDDRYGQASPPAGLPGWTASDTGT